MQPMAIHFHIEHQVLLANANFQEESSRVKKWQDKWEIKNVTIQNLEIEKIDIDDSLILVQGSIPGSVGSFVKITFHQ